MERRGEMKNKCADKGVMNREQTGRGEVLQD